MLALHESSRFRGGHSIEHQVIFGVRLFVIGALLFNWLLQQQAECSRVTRSATRKLPPAALNSSLHIEQEQRLLMNMPANSTERKNLEALFHVINDTKGVSEFRRSNVYALVERRRKPAANGRSEKKERTNEEVQQPYRKVAIEDTIFLKSAPQEAGSNMSLSFKGASTSDPTAHWTVLFNETTILVVRSANKYYYWTYAQTIAALVIFGFIVVGNLSILYRLKSHRRRRSNVNYFIVQLAIADLLVGIFNVTLDSVLRIQRAFTWGLFACQASKYISSLFIYSSTNLLVALSVDRWEAVVKPLAFTRNRSRGYQLVTGSWLLAVLSALPVAYFSRVKEIDGLPQCWIDLDRVGWRVYLIYLTSLLLVIPTLIIVICYVHIVYTIWSKARLVSEQQRQRNEQQTQRFKEAGSGHHTTIDRTDSSSRPRMMGERETRQKRSCLKAARLDGRAGADIAIEQRDGAGPAQLVKFNGRRKASVLSPVCGQKEGALAETDRHFGGAHEAAHLEQVAVSGARDEPRLPSDTLDVNNNAPAASASLTPSASSTSLRSSSSSSISATNSCASPLEPANDLDGPATAYRKVAARRPSAAVDGDAERSYLDSSPPTRAPDATISSNQRETPRRVSQLRNNSKQSEGEDAAAATTTRAKMEPDEAQRRSSRRALSEDLGGVEALGTEATDSSEQPARLAAAAARASARRAQCRRSSHVQQAPKRARPNDQTSQLSNSMISCDNLMASSSAMSRLAQKSFKKLAVGSGAGGQGGKEAASGSSRQGEFVTQQHGSGVIPKARIKTIKMTLVIVVAYILCWTPFLVLNLLVVFGIMQNDTIFSHAIMTMTQSLAHLNSAVNPIIFWLFSSKRHASDAKPPTTIIGNGQGHQSLTAKQLPASESETIKSKAGRLLGLLQDCFSQLRWLLTCCNLCGLLASDSGAAGQRYRTTDSRMFDRTTTTSMSRTSSRFQQQRSG